MCLLYEGHSLSEARKLGGLRAAEFAPSLLSASDERALRSSQKLGGLRAAEKCSLSPLSLSLASIGCRFDLACVLVRFPYQ